MNSILQVAMIIAIAFYFICLFTLLRKNKVTLKYILSVSYTHLEDYDNFIKELIKN